MDCLFGCFNDNNQELNNYDDIMLCNLPKIKPKKKIIKKVDKSTQTEIVKKKKKIQECEPGSQKI
jgi:hypothetical protein